MTRRRLVHLGRAIGIGVAVTASSARARAQDTTREVPGPADAVVRAVGPGEGGRILRDALAGPHTLLVAPDTGIVLGAGVRVSRTLVVIGGPVRVAASVQGDVVTVGDLFLRPGARIEGNAVAIGGGVYNSALAIVRGGRFAYRELAVDTTRLADRTLALDVRSSGATPVPLVSLPGRFGVRLPGYDRIDGLSLSFGPELALDTGRVRIEPLVTYRSHLGVVDPGVIALAELGRGTTVDVRAARATLTNDAWIRSELLNSALAFGTGVDTRNYYRADRGEGTLSWRLGSAPRVVFEPFVGAMLERAWSVARDSGARSAPFSVLGRRDRIEGPLRPNPGVDAGTIGSALAGARVRASVAAAVTELEARVEQSLTAPDDRRFTQLTLDGTAARVMPNEQRAQLFVHAVLGAGHAPAQRYAYLGGQGTLVTIPLLAQGGDRLVFGEARYTIPLRGVRIKFAGSPTVTPRYLVGAAGVGRLPALTHNVGVRVALSFLRADYVFDPTAPGRRDVSVGFGLVR